METRRSLDPILAKRAQFRAFLVSRLGNEADADDVLQNGLMKAMRSVETVDDGQKLTSWFYSVLQHALVDHARSRASRAAREMAWSADPTIHDHEARKTVCSCFEGLLPGLKPREAELVRRIELCDESVASVAGALGISPGAVSVALHRARATLRKGLEEFCGECARGGCLDCHCADPKD